MTYSQYKFSPADRFDNYAIVMVCLKSKHALVTLFYAQMVKRIFMLPPNQKPKEEINFSRLTYLHGSVNVTCRDIHLPRHKQKYNIVNMWLKSKWNGTKIRILTLHTANIKGICYLNTKLPKRRLFRCYNSVCIANVVSSIRVTIFTLTFMLIAAKYFPYDWLEMSHAHSVDLDRKDVKIPILVKCSLSQFQLIML